MERKKQFLKKEIFQCSMQGTITIEMSYILPIVLFVFMLIVYTIFYFHDKNILIGAAAETAVVGAQMERKPDEKGKNNLGAFYKQRIAGKLILFPESMAEVDVTEQQVRVTVLACRGKMKLEVKQQMPIVEPEKKIRKKRFLENMVEGESGETINENNNTDGDGNEFE